LTLGFALPFTETAEKPRDLSVGRDRRANEVRRKLERF